MEKYKVQCFDDDRIITVIKHDPNAFTQLAESCSRTLFDINDYRFLDCADAEDKDHYLILDFTDSDEPDVYELELKPYYDLVALYVHSETTHDYLLEVVATIIQDREQPNNVIEVDFRS
jgi:hypothetical protein